MDLQSDFRQWCLLEIMGHQRYAGLVTVETVGGAAFIRIDVPAVLSADGTEEVAPFSKLFSPASVYAITPIHESLARATAAQLRLMPIAVWDFSRETLSQFAQQRVLAGPPSSAVCDRPDAEDEFDTDDCLFT